MSQITNYLSSQRQKMYGAVGKVSIKSLKESAAKFSEVPEDIDEGCVLGRAFKTPPSASGLFKDSVECPILIENTHYRYRVSIPSALVGTVGMYGIPNWKCR